MAKAFEMAVTAWGLLEGGVLTGKYRRRGDEGATRYEGASERELAIGDAVVAVAEELGASPSQVAINWVRAQRARAQVLPILGVRSEAQLKENLGCLDVELTDDHLRRLDEASPFSAGFPKSFLESDGVRELIFGETFGLIDLPALAGQARRPEPAHHVGAQGSGEDRVERHQLEVRKQQEVRGDRERHDHPGGDTARPGADGRRVGAPAQELHGHLLDLRPQEQSRQRLLRARVIHGLRGRDALGWDDRRERRVALPAPFQPRPKPGPAGCTPIHPSKASAPGGFGLEREGQAPRS
jgi:hypothetical protein